MTSSYRKKEVDTKIVTINVSANAVIKVLVEHRKIRRYHVKSMYDSFFNKIDKSVIMKNPYMSRNRIICLFE